MDGNSIFVSLIVCLLLSACGKQPAPQVSEVQPQKSTPAQSIAVMASPAVTPSPEITPSATTGNIAFEKVASKLDAGGVAYLYWSTEKIFGELSRKFEPVADAAAADPDLTPGEKERMRHCLDLVSRCLAASGLQNVKAFGFSSKEIEPGVFLNKSYLYVPDRSGFLWESFTKQPHDLEELRLVPASAEAFAFYDFDLPLLWKAISKELKSSNLPEAVQWEEQISRQVQGFLGLGLDDLLDALDDRVGLIVTLDPQLNVDIPLGNKSYRMPAPAAAIVWKMKNAGLFDRLDALAKLNPKVQSTDEADLKLRVLQGMTELPYVSPSFAQTGSYLILSTSEKIVRAIVDVRRARSPGIKSSEDFARLAAGIPEKGNCVNYVSKVFQKILADLQIRFSEIHEAQGPLLEAVTSKFARLSADLATYGVGSLTNDGWIANGKATKDMNELAGEFASLPGYYFAIAATEYAKEGRQTGRLAKIKENLANLQAAKEEAIAERNFADGQILTRQDVGEYLTAWPDSIVGEIYEVGAVGQPPYATAPVDLGNYPAGTKIEP